ncbi:MAG: hypothetical protein ACFBWO_08505 [Paracoccaceae bacterium]
MTHHLRTDAPERPDEPSVPSGRTIQALGIILGLAVIAALEVWVWLSVANAAERWMMLAFGVHVLVAMVAVPLLWQRWRRRRAR